MNTNKRNAPEKGFYFIIRTVQRKVSKQVLLKLERELWSRGYFLQKLNQGSIFL